MKNKFLDRLGQLANKHSKHMIEDRPATDDEEREQNAAFKSCGLEEFAGSEELTPVQKIMWEGLKAFKMFVPACVAIGHADNENGNCEMRFMIPHQFQLDHSVAIKNAISVTKYVMARLAPNATVCTKRNKESIRMIYRGLL